jgi:thiamine biosynthesis lipoprotein
VNLLPPTLVARHAMATRFEFVLHGANAAALRAAAEEALDEVDRLENLLSLYRPHTDIARLNAGAAAGPVRIAPETFRLLQRAVALAAATQGAFDVTAGALVRAWGFLGGSGAVADPAALSAARAGVGSDRLELDEANFTVRFTRPGVLVDLGSIGKGYALDRAAGLLRDAGVTSALLHGGTSTVIALGQPPDAAAWKVALPEGSSVALRDESLSVSAGWGKSFTDAAGRELGHVLDPRRGEPVGGRRWAAVVAPSATDSDGLSTAALLAEDAELERLRMEFPAARFVAGGERAPA